MTIVQLGVYVLTEASNESSFDFISVMFGQHGSNTVDELDNSQYCEWLRSHTISTSKSLSIELSNESEIWHISLFGVKGKNCFRLIF